MTTIYDVARSAGVDASTVSYALSGKGTLSQATRARVIACARELGYRPNYVARSLVKRETRTLGLLVPDLSHPFYAELAQVAERVAHGKGYRVFVMSTLHDEELGQELLDDLSDRRVDGVIAVPGGVAAEAIHEARDAGLAVLCCFWEEAKVDVPSASRVDFETGGRIAADHLWGLGHRRIGLVTDLKGDREADHHLRVAGFQRAVASKGHNLDPRLVTPGMSTVEASRDAVLRMLDSSEPPTAIFATSDIYAIGALTAAWTRGLSVPGDLSVVGFDDIVTSAYTVPPLTTIRIDKAAVMTAALESLISGAECGFDDEASRLVPTLVERHSTGPVSARHH
jgi:DNA-binding LacI/PurR family transcriptional regulator